MSDSEDPLLAIIVGAVFGAVIIILGFRYIIVRCDKTKKNNNASSSTVKVIPSKSLSTSVVPQKIKLRRKVTHDPSNTEPRKIIERIRIGIELIFKEFDQSRNGLIDPEEFKALVITLAARSKVAPMLLPTANECDIIFEALDEDASGGISLDEWNLWILDGLSSSGLERQKMGLTDMGKKMDLMLVCLEQLANEAGKLLGQRERGQNNEGSKGSEEKQPKERSMTEEFELEDLDKPTKTTNNGVNGLFR